MKRSAAIIGMAFGAVVACDQGAFLAPESEEDTQPDAPGLPALVGDLAARGEGSEQVVLSFTEVDDGTGEPADYLVRFSETPYEHWGTAQAVGTGTCAGEIEGSAVGQSRACSITGLSPDTEYGTQIIAYRVDPDSTVWGPVSSVAFAITEAGATAETGSVTVSPDGYTFSAIGDSVTFTVEATDADGQVVQNPDVSWSSNNEDVVMIDSTGTAWAVSFGTATLIASTLCCGDAQFTAAVDDGTTDPEFTNEPAGFVALQDNPWTCLDDTGCWPSYNPRNAGAPSDIRIVQDGTDPTGQDDSVLELFYAEGHADGYDPGRTWYSVGGQEAFVGLWMKFSSNFSWHRWGVKQTLFNMGGVGWFYINGGGYGGGARPYDPPHQSVGSRALGFDPEVQPYLDGVGEVPYTRGEWMKVEWYVKLNDPGQANGVTRLWIDGVLVTDVRDLMFPSDVNELGVLSHAGTWGGGGEAVPHDQYIRFARTYVSVPQ